MKRHRIGSIVLGLLIMTTLASTAQTLDSFLREGRVKEGLSAYATASDNAGRFSLAVLQALDGVQGFSAGLDRLGIRPDFVQGGLPFFRLASPKSPAASIAKEPATPAKVSSLFNDLRAALRRANATLSQVDDREFQVEVNLAQARLDLDGDGQSSPDEAILQVLGRGLGLGAGGPDKGELIVRFDSADAVWLKGYTHFVSGLLDLLMAYDWRPVWNQCAHVLFVRPEPLPPIAPFLQPHGRFEHWPDLIAAVHELRLPLIEKDGLRHARDEFRAMISCSRISWQRILAETDDDREWLPSPKQTGPGGAKITQAQVEAWQHILDELDDVASGKKLLPHWRLKPGVGINVEKWVDSPPTLDLILLLQGSGWVPYLEEGPVSDAARWSHLIRTFGPSFLRFALWSN